MKDASNTVNLDNPVVLGATRGLDQITCPKVGVLDQVIGLIPTYPRYGWGGALD